MISVPYQPVNDIEFARRIEWPATSWQRPVPDHMPSAISHMLLVFRTR